MIVFDHTNDLVWLRYTSHVLKIALYAEVTRPFKHYFGRLEPFRERHTYTHTEVNPHSNFRKTDTLLNHVILFKGHTRARYF